MASRISQRVAKLHRGHLREQHRPLPFFIVLIDEDRFSDVAAHCPIIADRFALDLDEPPVERRDVTWKQRVERFASGRGVPRQRLTVERWEQAIDAASCHINGANIGPVPEWARRIAIDKLSKTMPEVFIESAGKTPQNNASVSNCFFQKD